jgi:serine/threonine-protein kinase
MSFVGKIGYAPREQVTMSICSPSSDLYSLGVTAIVLLTGKDPTLLLDRYSLQWRWTPYTRVSPAFKTILDKMTEEIPQKRYQSSQEVLRDIERNLINCETCINPLNGVESSPAKPQRNFRSEETVIISNVDVQPLNVNSPQQSSSEETVIISNVDVQPLNVNYPQQSSSEETVIISNVDVQPLNAQPQNEHTTSQPENHENYTSFTKTQLFDVDNSDDRSSSSSSKVNRPTPTMEETMIISNVSPTPLSSSLPPKFQSNSTRLNTSSHQKRTLKPQFVKLCRHHLVEYMGNMADTIVDEILIQNMPKTPQALVDAIARKIPNSDQVEQFKQKLWEQ